MVPPISGIVIGLSVTMLDPSSVDIIQFKNISPASGVAVNCTRVPSSKVVVLGGQLIRREKA